MLPYIASGELGQSPVRLHPLESSYAMAVLVAAPQICYSSLAFEVAGQEVERL